MSYGRITWDSDNRKNGNHMNGDRINELYHGQIFSAQTQKLARERLHWMCRQAVGEDILDIGCSQGMLCLLLGREGFRCIGVDIEQQSVTFAKGELEKEEELVRKRVSFQQLDATALPFPDQSFDTVFMGEILEHLTNPGRILREARRVLREGGTAIITVPLGLNAAPDHKTTYYPLSFLEVVRPFFEPLSVELTEGNILFTGRRSTSYDPASVCSDHLLRDWQKVMEKRCLEKEEGFLEKTTELYKKISVLNEELSSQKKVNSNLLAELEAARANAAGAEEHSSRATETNFRKSLQEKEELCLQMLQEREESFQTALQEREAVLREALQEKEHELELLRTKHEAELAKMSREKTDKERYLLMALQKQGKEFEELMRRKTREFAVREKNLKQMLAVSEQEKEEVSSASAAFALELEMKELAFQQALLIKEQESRARENQYLRELVEKSAEINRLLAGSAGQLEEQKDVIDRVAQEWQGRLAEAQKLSEQALQVKSDEISSLYETRLREIETTLAAKSQELDRLKADHAREVEGREKALQELRTALEREHQARLREKEAEAEQRVKEVRQSMQIALAQQEDMFRTAYSWRLGSIFTGSAALAIDVVKNPTAVGSHLRSYYRKVNPEPRKPVAPAIAFTPSASTASAPAALPAQPVKAVSPEVIRRDKIALGCILDEFTIECFRPECRMITFRPDNWKEAVERDRPNAIFVESAWRGNDGSWQYRVAQYQKNMGDELHHLLAWAKQNKIPSFFWNKEDPVHYERFNERAKHFDYVFTTDADCVPRYRQELGHDKVFALPFAAQPAIQNPITDLPREKLACFAGTYYGTTFPERRKDMEYLLRPALDLGLHIYDRQFGTVGPEAEKYRFPEIYQSAIKGRLEFDEMVKAYKRYRVFLNVNSVKESPTMFSRRVFELLACGTPVISTYSRGIEEIFGRDLVLFTESEADTRLHLERLFNDEDYWARLSVKGMREVMESHTYSKRMYTMLSSMGIAAAAPDRARFTIFAKVASANEAQVLHVNLRRQSYRNFDVAVIADKSSCKAELKKVQQALPEIRIEIFSNSDAAAYKHALQLSNSEYVAVFDSNSFYGRNYLNDYALALTYSKPSYLGKGSHLRVENQSVKLINAGSEFIHVNEAPVATLAIHKPVINLNYFPTLIGNRNFSISGRKIQSLDRFNYARIEGPLEDRLIGEIEV